MKKDNLFGNIKRGNKKKDGMESFKQGIRMRNRDGKREKGDG